LKLLVLHWYYISPPLNNWDCHGHDHMVVGFTTTCQCVISAYHH